MIGGLLQGLLLPFGFDDWKNLSNPDVFQLTLTKNEVHMERLWRQETIIN